MRKIELEKNRLDLAYKRNLQLLNAVLVVGVGSFIAYLTGLILNPDKMFQYSILLVILGFVSFILYRNISNNLRGISDQINKLAT